MASSEFQQDAIDADMCGEGFADSDVSGRPESDEPAKGESTRSHRRSWSQGDVTSPRSTWRASEKNLNRLLKGGPVRPRILDTVDRATQMPKGTIPLSAPIMPPTWPISDPKFSAIGDAIKSAGAVSALGAAIDSRKFGIMDALAASTAARIPFTITTGLSFSGPIKSTIANVMPVSTGIGSAFCVLHDDDVIIGNAFRSISNLGAIDMSLSGIVGPVRALASQKLAVNSGISALISNNAVMKPWRQTLLAESTARALVGTMEVSNSGVDLLSSVLSINTTTARVFAQFAKQNRALMRAPERSARPTRLLREYLNGIPEDPDDDTALLIGVHASRSVAGIVATDLLETGGDLDERSSDLFEAEVVESWVAGPLHARSDLLGTLNELDSEITDLLRNAWAQIESDLPAAVAMASGAAVEVLDRSLRALAPDEAVLSEVHTGRLKRSEYVHEPKAGNLAPTRAGRVAYIIHQTHPDDEKLANELTKMVSVGISVLIGRLQAGKHRSAGNRTLLRSYLTSVESNLSMLLLPAI